MLFFSIIVPIYKVEKYLDECIQSVLSQTFTDYECILVDDGSPDNCSVICDEYAERDSRIKVIHKENGGLSDARNAGILQARGEYIILLDSDDKLADCNTLENLFNVVEKYKTDVVVSVRTIRFLDSGENYMKNSFNRNVNIASPKIIVDNFRKSHVTMTAWIFVVNKEYLIRNNLFFKKGILHEDEHWVPRILFGTESIAINHSPFYAYRKGRSDSIMGSKISPKKLLDLLVIMNDLLEWSENEKLYTKVGCEFMSNRAKCFWQNVYFLSKKIKYNDEESYGIIREKLKFFSKKCLNSKIYIISLFIGIDGINFLQKIYIKIKCILKPQILQAEIITIKKLIKKGLSEKDISNLVEVTPKRLLLYKYKYLLSKSTPYKFFTYKIIAFSRLFIGKLLKLIRK